MNLHSCPRRLGAFCRLQAAVRPAAPRGGELPRVRNTRSYSFQIGGQIFTAHHPCEAAPDIRKSSEFVAFCRPSRPNRYRGISQVQRYDAQAPPHTARPPPRLQGCRCGDRFVCGPAVLSRIRPPVLCCGRLCAPQSHVRVLSHATPAQ